MKDYGIELKNEFDKFSKKNEVALYRNGMATHTKALFPNEFPINRPNPI
jgi:hypothetical protein